MAITLTPIPSQGVTLKIKVANAFVVVKGVTDISGLGGGSSTVNDVTDLSSVAKEKLIGLMDEGQVKVSLNYIPDDPGQLAIEAARNTSAKTAFEVQLSDATKYAFDAFALMFDKSFAVDKQATASVSLEVTGAVTKSKAA